MAMSAAGQLKTNTIQYRASQVKSDTDHMWMQARCEGTPIIVFGVGGEGIKFRLNEIVKARVRIDDNPPHEMKALI
jgi:hypothetical protein